MRGIVRGVASRAWAAVLAGTLTTSMLAPVGAAARAAAEPAAFERSDEIRTYELPLDEVRSVLGGEDEVYVTGDDELLVIDLEGDVLAVIEDLPEAGPLALDPGGEVLFVGLRGTDEVVAFDVEDLEELDAWDLPAAPISLAVTDEYLHVGIATTSSSGRIVTIHLEGEVADRTTTGRPLLAVLGEELLVAHAGTSAGRVSRRAPNGAEHVPAVSRNLGGFVRDVVGDGEAGRLWIAGSGQEGPSYSVHALDLASLAITRSVKVGAYPVAVAPLQDASYVATGRDALASDPDVAVWNVSDGKPVTRLWLGGTSVDRGLSVADDGTLLALTATSSQRRSWLTIVPTPQQPLPELRVDAARAEIGRSFQVTGRVLDASGAAVPDLALHLEDAEGSVATSSTAPDGSFSFAAGALDRLGRHTYEVTFAGDATYRSAAAEARVDVTRRTTAIAGRMESVRTGEPLELSGAVTDPEPVAGAIATVELRRSGVLVDVREVVTDRAGGFATTYADLGVGSYTALVRSSQTGTHTAAQRSLSADVRRWNATLEVSAELTAGIEGWIRGRLADEDGRPIAGAAVDVTVSGDALGTVETDADGDFGLRHTAASPGPLRLGVSTPASPRHTAASTWSRVEVEPDRPIHTLAPVSATATTPVTLRGTVTDSLGGVAVGLGADIRVHDADGLVGAYPVVTGTSGRWSVTFTPRRGGTHRVTTTTFGEGRFVRTESTHSFSAARAETAITLDALSSPVVYGAPTRLGARLLVPRGVTVDLVAVNLATGTEQRLVRTLTDSNGRVTFDTAARVNTRYEARFRGNATYAPSKAARTVRVRSAVTASLSGHDRTVSGEPSYPRKARPTVDVRVRSATPAMTVAVTLERWNGERWVAAQRWTAKTASDGRVTTRVPSGLGAGRYRVRVTAPETPSNLAGDSAWARLRVR